MAYETDLFFEQSHYKKANKKTVIVETLIINYPNLGVMAKLFDGSLKCMYPPYAL